jgi:hypothetical protein
MEVSGQLHAMSLPTQTVGLWVRIPLEEWMSVCVLSMFILSCVDRGLTTGWSPAQGVLPTVSKINNFTIMNGHRPESLIRQGRRRRRRYWKWCGALWGLIPAFICREIHENRSVPAGNRNGHLPNRRQKRYRLGQLARLLCLKLS